MTEPNNERQHFTDHTLNLPAAAASLQPCEYRPSTDQAKAVLKALWDLGLCQEQADFAAGIAFELVRQERERCTKIADGYARKSDCYYCDDAEEIAAEIRKGLE